MNKQVLKILFLGNVKYYVVSFKLFKRHKKNQDVINNKKIRQTPHFYAMKCLFLFNLIWVTNHNIIHVKQIIKQTITTSQNETIFFFFNFQHSELSCNKSVFRV